MFSFFLTAGSLTFFVLLTELFAWMLFARHMKPLHFPIGNDAERSRTRNLDLMRLIAWLHTFALVIFIWTFCFSLWW